MVTQTMIAFAKAVDGRKEELNDWFENQHVPDLLRVPGFRSAQRLALSAMGAAPLNWDFMTLYVIESDDFGATLKDMGSRFGTPAMPLSDALERTSSLTLLGRELSFATASSAEQA